MTRNKDIFVQGTYAKNINATEPYMCKYIGLFNGPLYFVVIGCGHSALILYFLSVTLHQRELDVLQWNWMEVPLGSREEAAKAAVL